MVWRAGSPSWNRARSSASSLMRFKGPVSEKSGDGGTPRAYTGTNDSVCQVLTDWLWSLRSGENGLDGIRMTLRKV